MKTSKGRIIIYSSILLIFSLVFGCILIEAGSAILLRMMGHERKAFLINRLSQFTFADLQIVYDFIDPTLGYAPSKPFRVYNGNLKTQTTLIALGGSTTAPDIQPVNWPQELADFSVTSHHPVTVLNGGVGGYSSGQELLKLLRDGLHQKQSIVVSFNGINDLGSHSLPDHPLLNYYQVQLFKTFLDPTPTFFPNIVTLSQIASNHLFNKRVLGLSLGDEETVDFPKQWEKNVRLMHAVSEEMKSHYLVFLQPTLGIGKYIPTEQEKKDFDGMGWKEYPALLQAFYNSTEKICGQLTYCVNLTALFDGQTDLYHDPRHPNPKGYRIIAERIFQELRLRKFL